MPQPLENFDPGPTPLYDDELDSEIYARHAEIKTFADLEKQRGTPIPALFNIFYKFIQNPSTVSVETYKRMIDTDDTIGSGVDFLTSCLQARLGPYVHPDEAITEWLQRALDEISGGWTNMMKELLGAAWAGFAVQEKVWANDPELGFIVKKLVSLPPQSVLFETERTGDITDDGILQYQRNFNPMLLGVGPGSFFGFSNQNGRSGKLDPWAKFGDMPFPLRSANMYSYLSIRIPKQKCIHYAFDAQGKFGNPYGRALAPDTPVLTDNGWSTMGTIAVGDRLFDENGQICRVKAKSETWKDRATYRVSFSDGTTIDADENHEWLTTTLGERRHHGCGGIIRTTAELYAGMQKSRAEDRIFAIRKAKTLQLPKRGLLVDPYILGMWLGDGDSNGARVTTHVDDSLDLKGLIEAAGYQTSDIFENGKAGGKGRKLQVYSGLQTQLRVMGLIKNKHIPVDYLLASAEQRLALLQGLMDSDGSITRAGYKFADGYESRGGYASFANCNRSLIDGVAQLVRSLGMQCSIGAKKRGWGTKWKLDAWEVRFTPGALNVFRFPRKAARQQRSESKRASWIYIRSIERIQNQDTVCIEVDSPSHLFLAGHGLTPTHNSLLRRAYKWYVMKDAFLQMLSVALDRKGTPLTIVFADPNVTLQTGESAMGGVNQKGNRAPGIRADAAAAKAFANIHNDSTIILPGKKAQVFDTEFVPQDAHADQFLAAIQECNKGIMRALLIPSLIFTNGDGTGSYALGEQHAKTFDKILDSFLGGFKQTLQEQFIKELLAYNFPRAQWKTKKGFGKFSSIELSPDEIKKETEIWSDLQNIGAVDMNDLEDLNTIRGKARLPPRLAPIEPVLNDEMGNPLPPGSPRPKPAKDDGGDDG